MCRILSFFYLVITIIIISGCASNKIELSPDFRREIEVKEDQEVLISWDFKNADRVKFDSSDENFNPIDLKFIKATKSRKYKLIAYKGQSDSLVEYVEIKVTDSKNESGLLHNKMIDETSNETVTGADKNKLKNQPSSIYSEYFNGILNYKDAGKPAYIRVTSTKIDSVTGESIARALILDSYGNYISGLVNRSNDNLNVIKTCGSITSTIPDLNFHEIISKDSSNTDIALLIDNSAASDNMKFISYLKDFANEIDPKNRVMVSLFNQNYRCNLPLTNADKAADKIENIDLIKIPSGLNGINKAAYKALDELNQNQINKKIMIIFTYQSDNTSLVYMEDEVSLKARKLNIPIYIIGIGDGVFGHNLRYICSFSGGEYYFIFKNEYGKIPFILREILFSQKNYYEINLPNNLSDNNCSNTKLTLNYNFADTSITDKFNIISKVEELWVPHQILAIFNKQQASINSDYQASIRDFSVLLKLNKQKKIVLIGYSWGDDDEKDKYFSNERADAVKKELVKNGVNPDQISIRIDGSKKPVYPVNDDSWMANINRRVEVRWLDPKLLPYEILAEQALNEEQAETYVGKWIEKGYKSYFDRFWSPEKIYYQVKIWGFATENDVLAEMKKLTAKNKKKKFEVITDN